MTKFIHLHVHDSQGSMVDSLVDIDELFKKASQLKMSAIALTDHGTLAGCFDAYQASKKHNVKFIPGIEAYFTDDVNNPKDKRRHLVLLARNETGYRNLLRLNYEGFVNRQYVAVLNKVFSRIDWDLLEKYHDGLICLSACSSGPIARKLLEREEDGTWNKKAKFDEAVDVAKRLYSIFGDDFYLELQPHNLQVYKKNRKTGNIEIDPSGMPIVVVDQKYLNNCLIKISKILGINKVATCDVHYLNKEDAEIHDMLMAISSKTPLDDKNRHRYEVNEFYLKSGDEVVQFFAENFNKKLGENLCKNTCVIAEKCEEPDYLATKEIRFPKFPVEDEPDYEEFLGWFKEQKFFDKIQEDHAFMRYRCVRAFKEKFSKLGKRDRKEYISRMNKEVKVLEQHNFSSYMLIVADYIQKAKDNGIRIGSGRGSVGGSLVGYLLDIHTVNPMEYGLIFERFHNKEKKSFPDIDTDIHPDGRVWVQEYIVKKYGKKNVAHVSNLSRMTPKVAIKDIARSLMLGGDKSKAFKIANKITDSIPDACNTFDEAYAKSKEFRDYCEQYPDLKKYGPKLAGLERAYATHAAGVVISDIDLTTYVPLRIDKEGEVSVQYEKERCEALGLIKMDLLGLEHLKIIDNAIRNAEKLGAQIPETLYPYNDKAVWNEVSKGHTTCVFQMGSPHMRALCKKIKPQSVEELGLVNTLGRPSLAGFRNEYIARRNGIKKVEYKYKCLEPALKDSLGICIYEDQLMKLASTVAGWDLNDADNLRKITKGKGKFPELTQKTKEKFIEDSSKFSKISKEDATNIWDEIIGAFEGYGFNLAHATAYSINGYETAWFAYHHPAAFMAAVLESEAGKGSSPAKDANMVEYKAETKRLGIDIQVPDINISNASYSIKDEKTITTGLNAIKGVGDAAIDNIIATRNEKKFKSFADFLYRTKSSVVKKPVIQGLAKAGCFDSLGITRKNAHDYYDKIRTKVNKHMKDGGIIEGFVYNLDEENEWSFKEKLGAEQEVLGEVLSGSINDLYEGFFTNMGTSFSNIQHMHKNASVRIEVIVTGVKTRKLKKGKNAGKSFAECSIVDKNQANMQMTVWPDQWVKFKEFLSPGRALKAITKVNVYNGIRGLVLERIENYAK